MRFICLLAIILAGCATGPKQPTPATFSAPPPPPIPGGYKPSMMRAFSFPASSAAVTAAVVPTNAPGYALVSTVPIDHEDGSVTKGVYIQWNNWPSGVPYVIERSADLKTWTTAFESEGDDGRMLLIADPAEKIETFRIRTNGVTRVP